MLIVTEVVMSNKECIKYEDMNQVQTLFFCLSL